MKIRKFTSIRSFIDGNDILLSHYNHRKRYKSSVMKKSVYMAFFLFSSIVFSSPTLAKSVCKTVVTKEEGTPALSPELMDAMHDVIIANSFDPDEPFTLISTKKVCTEGNIPGVLDAIPSPSPTPQEGDTYSTSQTRRDANGVAYTYTWTYTYTNGNWEITGYSKDPAPPDWRDPE